MPANWTIRITGAPDPARVADSLRQPLLRGAARGLTNALVRHFRQRNRTPNARGFPRSNFWLRAAESVTSRAEGDRAVATITEPGVALRRFGGVVRPKGGRRALAIPARPEAAGMNPREASGLGWDLVPIWPKSRSFGMLARRANGRLRAWWWLVPKTTHKADPSALPLDADLEKAVERAMRGAARALG